MAVSCRFGQVHAGCRREAGAGFSLRQAEQPRAVVADGVGEQAGDVHLGDAKLLADLRLRHVTVKAYPQDLLLTKGQLAPVRGDGPAYRACRSLERGRDRRMPSSSWSSSPARFLKHPRRGR
jgi:hypothetical protein